MDQEERKMLERLLAISEQTNRIVRRMRREELLVRFLHIFYWLVIFAMLYMGLYYVRPYIEQVSELLQTMDTIKMPR